LIKKTSSAITEENMIYIRPITPENWREALTLRVDPEQGQYVPSVVMSLAKAYIKPNGITHDPCGIYSEENQIMVGFYSFMFKPHDTRVCYIGGFIIDRRYQGFGYGKAAMKDYLETVQQRFPNCEGVYLTVHPENRAAEKFYNTFGFVKTGLVIDGEDAMGLTLS
jgi:diamine N-acetyltransferase